MAAVTAAVVGATVAVKGAVDARKARKEAAKDVKDANIQSASLLEEAGRDAEADILRANTEAIESVALGSDEAEGRISPFVGPGQEAFRQAQEQILGNLPISGPLADSIRNASTEFLKSRPNMFNLSGPVGAEVERQGDIAVSGATPEFRSSLLGQAQRGISATGDVAGIRQRGIESLADIAGATGAQRGSVLVGQTPELLRLSQGADEARLLGQVADRGGKAQVAEQLAQLAGRAT